MNRVLSLIVLSLTLAGCAHVDPHLEDASYDLLADLAGLERDVVDIEHGEQLAMLSRDGDETLVLVHGYTGAKENWLNCDHSPAAFHSTRPVSAQSAGEAPKSEFAEATPSLKPAHQRKSSWVLCSQMPWLRP